MFRWTILLTVAVSLSFTAAAPAALIASYPLDVINGNTTPDVAGGHTGTLVDQAGGALPMLAPPSPAPGSTASFLFDGTDDLVDALGFKAVTGTTSRAFSAWVVGAPGNDAIMSWGENTGGEKWVVRVNDNAGNGDVNTLRVEVNGGFQIGSTNIADGAWHHIAGILVDDGSPNANEIRLYVDGRIEAISGNQGQLINTNGVHDFRIGDDSHTANRHWPGLIDEVYLFDNAVSSGQIRQLFNGSVAPIATLEYDATNESNTGDAIWQEQNQTHNPGTVDWDVSGQMRMGTNERNMGIDAAYAFDGTDFATLGNGNMEALPGNPTNNSASFEIWFRPTDLVGQEVLWEVGGDTDGASFTLNNDVLQFAAKDNANTAGDAASLAGLEDFIQAVGVVDLENDLVTLFVNGQEVSNLGANAFAGGDWAGSNVSGLGGADGQTGANGGLFGALAGYGNFDGKIAIARFYEEALTAADVAALFAQNQAVPEPATMTLLGLAGAALIRRRRRAA